MNNILKLNKKINVGLKSGYVNNTLTIDYLEINGLKYFDCKTNQSQLSIESDLLKDQYVAKLHEIMGIKLDKKPTVNDISIFINNFKYFIDKYDIDITNKANDIIVNELFVAYKSKLIFTYNIKYIFDGYIDFKLNNARTKFDLETLSIDELDSLIDSDRDFKILISIFKVLNKDINYVQEYINLIKFLENKKSIKIDGKQHKQPSMYNLLKLLKDSSNKLIRYARTSFLMYHLDSIIYYWNLNRDQYSRI